MNSISGSCRKRICEKANSSSSVHTVADDFELVYAIRQPRAYILYGRKRKKVTGTKSIEHTENQQKASKKKSMHLSSLIEPLVAVAGPLSVLALLIAR